MNKLFLALALAAGMVSVPGAAQAAEVFGGIYGHAVGTRLSLGSSRESGVDVQIGYRGGRIFPKLGLRPHVFGAVNSKGDTSYAAVGLSWKLGEHFYVRPGAGVAIHNGSTEDFVVDDRIAFGSRVLIETEVAVGARVNDRLSVEASLVHLSHGQVFGGQNPGIDNIGVRVNLKL